MGLLFENRIQRVDLPDSPMDIMAGKLAKADLHIHSTCSDGALSPSAVVDLAASRGVVHMALTDHDTVEGLAEARRRALAAGLGFSAGVELSAVHEGEPVHLLGYDFDESDESLLSHLRHVRSIRLERAERIVAALSRAGLVIKMEWVLREAGKAAPTRTHIALAMVREGVAMSTGAAFRDYLSDSAGYATPVDATAAIPALRLLHAAGGWASLAHPGQWCRHDTFLDLVAGGLDAIEVVHPSHDPDLCRYYAELAERTGIGMTGGSDFHGHVTGEEERIGTYVIDSDELLGWKRARGIGV
jgi:predicted metal-dependent phosphoesterase TrpH